MIGILSDSHDNLFNIRRAMALFKSRGCRLLVHAGDIVAPFAARELEAAGCPVKAVFGNCDGEKKGLRTTIEAFGEIGPAPLVFDWEGKRVLLTHVPVRVDEDRAAQTYDVIICGHTHTAEIRRKGRSILINPGEVGGWLYGKSTIALFDPASGEAEIVSLD